MKHLVLCLFLMCSGCLFPRTDSGSREFDASQADEGLQVAALSLRELAPIWETGDPDLSSKLLECADLLDDVRVYLVRVDSVIDEFGSADDLLGKVSVALDTLDELADMLSPETRSRVEPYLASARILLGVVEIHFSSEPSTP